MRIINLESFIDENKIYTSQIELKFRTHILAWEFIFVDNSF